MILCDVNVYLNALFAELPHHAPCRNRLTEVLGSDESFGTSDLALAAVVRIASNPRAFRRPRRPAEVFAWCDRWRNHPRSIRCEPGERHWTIFRDLVDLSAIAGPDTTDAWFAALAIEHGCEWWTVDVDFRRFPGLRWRDLRAG